MSRHKPGVGKQERGQSLVEFAFAVPILLFVVCGILEFGVVFFNQITLSDAAAIGARYGALSASPTPTTSQSEQKAASHATDSAQGLIQCPPTVVPTEVAGPNGSQMQVTVSCSYQFITPVGSLARLFGGSFGGSLPLKATAHQQMEP